MKGKCFRWIFLLSTHGCQRNISLKIEFNKFYDHAAVPESMNEKLLLHIYLYVTHNISWKYILFMVNSMWAIKIIFIALQLHCDKNKAFNFHKYFGRRGARELKCWKIYGFHNWKGKPWIAYCFSENKRISIIMGSIFWFPCVHVHFT